MALNLRSVIDWLQSFVIVALAYHTKYKGNIMGFMDAVKAAFKGYVDFNGTATRPAFWYFVLFYIIALIVAVVIDSVLFGAPAFLYFAVSLGLLLPNLAVSIRRLHDMGKSGWWLLIAFVPIVGLIVLIYFYVQPSKTADNIYR